jgi:hypothetical protein
MVWIITDKTLVSLLIVLSILIVTMLLTRRLRVRVEKGMPLPPIRRLEGFDAIEDAVSNCQELGRPVHMFFAGSYGALDKQDAMATMAGAAVLDYLAGICAKNDVPFFTTMLSRGEFVPVAIDRTYAAYEREGKIQNWNKDYVVRMMGHWDNVSQEIYRENAGAHIYCGAVSPCTSVHSSEAANRIGATVIFGNNRMNVMHLIPALADHVMLGEEIFAAGAYANPEPLSISILESKDVYRYIILALLLLGSALVTFGNTAIVDFLST